MTKVMGGPAQPVKVITGGKRIGGPARRVYGYAAAPTDGRKALGGPALPVVVLTDADLKENGGSYVLDGLTYAMPVFTAPADAKVIGGPAIPVYPVNVWPTAAAVQSVVSAEIGNIAANTLVLNGAIDWDAPDYAAGFSVVVNGSAATIVSATRQADTTVLYIVLSAAVVYGDTVTIAYSSATGAIVGLATFGAMAVTNNVSSSLLASLVAEYTANGVVTDASGNGHTLTDAGTVPYTTGKVYAQAWDFLDSQKALTINSADFNFSGSFTIVFWLNTNSYSGAGGTYRQVMLRVGWGSGAADGMDIKIPFNNQLATVLYGGAGVSSILHANNLLTGAWQMFVVQYDATSNLHIAGTDDSLYVNQAFVPGVGWSTAVMTLGYHNNSSQNADYLLGPTLFYSRLLTGTELSQLYNFGAGLPHPLAPPFYQVVVHDKFWGADNSDLADHTISPTNVPATSWTVTGTMKIVSNHASLQNGTGVCNPGIANGTFWLRQVATTDTGWRLIFRYVDAQNYWALSNVDGAGTVGANLSLIKVAANVTTYPATIAHTWVGNDYLKVVANGNSIVGSAGADSVSVTDTFNASATQAGFSGALNRQLSDFIVSRVTT